MEYKVIRQHYGDRQYFSGESREVTNEHDANELIKLGLIAPFDDGNGGDNGKQGNDEQDNPPADPKSQSQTCPQKQSRHHPTKQG